MEWVLGAARARLCLGEFIAALQLASHALDIDPIDLEAIGVKALVFQVQGDLRNAGVVLTAVPTRPGNYATVSLIAEQARLSRQFPTAISLWSAYLAAAEVKSDDESVAAKEQLAHPRLLTGDTAAANITLREVRDELEKQRGNRPADPWPVASLALVYANLKEPVLARTLAASAASSEVVKNDAGRTKPCVSYPVAIEVRSAGRTKLRSPSHFEVVRRAVRRYHRTTMFLPIAATFLCAYVRVARGASSALPLLAFLLCSACASSGGRIEAADDPTLVAETAVAPHVHGLPMAMREAKDEGETEVPAAVAESEQREAPPKTENLPELVVEARERHLVIRDLVAEGQEQLRDVELEYVFTGKGGREVLRGRPVAFALWSEWHKNWTIAHLEIPCPPVKWKPGRGPLPFTVRTPGIEARHVKGTGAERLMFAFSRNGEELKVYGRKFPVFDNTLIKKKRWREAVATARPIVYLPYTKDTFDPRFVTGGRDFLLTTARRAMDDLRNANVPSAAFPGELLADVVPAEVITTLAVIEQTDDEDFLEKGRDAFDEVLSQYGLKREEAYRYSVSSAKALGPMQFTNQHGNGTYSLVVRRCNGAELDPNFERGATRLLNAMKAAVCLLDIELSQMSSEIRSAYRTNPEVLGIFAVAAYNGGPRNVAKLYRALDRMGVKLGELRRAGQLTPGSAVACPCVWREEASAVRAVSIPRYNRENSGYIEKYQRILSLFD